MPKWKISVLVVLLLSAITAIFFVRGYSLAEGAGKTYPGSFAVGYTFGRVIFWGTVGAVLVGGRALWHKTRGRTHARKE
jgi:hypothetical protein